MHSAIEEGRDYSRSASCWSAASAGCSSATAAAATASPAPVDRQLLVRVKDRMHADTPRARLEDLAAEVGLTTFQLIGLFKRTVGLTPHAYLTQVRLNMACRRLRHRRCWPT